jgi:fumarate reductase flavoprotein subunit
MEYSHWRANARLVRTIVDESATTIDWLEQQGVVFTGQMINMPRVPRPITLSRKRRGRGQALASRVKEKGAIFSPGTPVTSIQKESGHISGVVVETTGKRRK